VLPEKTEKKMKHFFVLGFIAFMASGLFAQTDNSPPEQDSSQLVLRIDNWFSFYDYQLFDGTALKRKDVNALIKTVPENTGLLRQKTGLFIANVSFATLAFSGLMAAFLYPRDSPNANIVFRAGMLIGFFSLTVEGITYQWGEDVLQRAVDNYNLSVMGIPIPVKKR
jgi:hypothetical protein